MRPDLGAGRDAAELRGGALADLRAEVPPLVLELAAGHREDRARAHGADAAAVEAVAAAGGLVGDAGEVLVDGRDGSAGGAEALELRVVAVAARPAAQNGAGEQALAPEGDEAPGVEVRGVEAPDADDPVLPAASWGGAPRAAARARSRAGRARAGRGRASSCLGWRCRWSRGGRSRCRPRRAPRRRRCRPRRAAAPRPAARSCRGPRARRAPWCPGARARASRRT